MFEIFYRIFYMIAVLPVLIFIEGNTMLADFLKKKKIYSGWDVWHLLLVVLILGLVVLLAMGYR